LAKAAGGNVSDSRDLTQTFQVKKHLKHIEAVVNFEDLQSRALPDIRNVRPLDALDFRPRVIDAYPPFRPVLVFQLDDQAVRAKPVRQVAHSL
jgi:hypothetical protein